jgi:hypothetical protein
MAVPMAVFILTQPSTAMVVTKAVICRGVVVEVIVEAVVVVNESIEQLCCNANFPMILLCLLYSVTEIVLGKWLSGPMCGPRWRCKATSAIFALHSHISSQLISLSRYVDEWQPN